MSEIHYSDFLEKQVGENLQRCGIEFIHESQKKEQGLDFYLPFFDVYIEVKQYHTDRISKQLASQENVIVLQGKAAVKMFCVALEKSSLTPPTK